MFKSACAPLALACTAFVSACATTAPAATDAAADLATDPQKFSYSIGADIGHNLSQPQIKGNVDVPSLEKGLEESFAGKPLRLTDQQRTEIKTAISKQIQAQQAADRAAAVQKNKDEGDKFLADNAIKTGVKTTASGLQYEVLTEGQGDHPAASDKVTVNYKGSLLDGTVFDSSYDRGQPVSFPLGNVIPGWTEGVQLMTPGSKYKFYIPAKLAYGERGAPPKIGPNSTLVFEVELIGVEKAAAAPAPAPAKSKVK